jgi:hypothetical protein
MNEGDPAVTRGATGLQAETGFAIVLESELAGKNDRLAGIKNDEELIFMGTVHQPHSAERRRSRWPKYWLIAGSQVQC